ncbi:MAG: murein L,D-transpeptidase, partial [Pseudomonadota bacterium]
MTQLRRCFDVVARRLHLGFTVLIVSIALSAPVAAQVTAFKQAVAEAAASDPALATFYRERNYEPIWTGSSAEDRARRIALLEAVSGAERHGLPAAQYAPEAI